MKNHCTIGVRGPAILAALAAAGVAGATTIDLEISQDNSVQHRLQISLPTQVPQPYELPQVNDGPLAGYYASIEPGWDGLMVNRPDGVHFGLLAPTGIGVRLLSASPGFVMFDSLLNPILTDPAEIHLFSGDDEGNSDLWWHEHLRFGVEPGNPLGLYSATFQLTDVEGRHADSEVFTLRFAAVPEPSSALLALVVATMALRRR